MHELTILHLGPLEECQLFVRQYMVLTGYQASGKSTIAKAIYFFRTLKDDLYRMILKRSQTAVGSEQSVPRLEEEFRQFMVSKFFSVFGTMLPSNPDMELHYRYAENVEVSVRFGKMVSDDEHGLFMRASAYFRAFSKLENNHPLNEFKPIQYSSSIRDFLRRETYQIESLKKELEELFHDSSEIVYIPAGRSMMTLLSGQFNYLYSLMDDKQKKLLDACTRDYLERVMRLRPQFSNGLEGLLAGEVISENDKALYKKALELIDRILKGRYAIENGEERIWFNDRQYVKLNVASSGQQECVWILNMLFYYLLMKTPAYLIVEEPESNLFPESQKLIVELLSLAANAGNALLVTTHSPYVLGEINNLLYAGVVQRVDRTKTEALLPACEWIDETQFDARFVKDGRADSCMDAELRQIDNSLMDEISRVINREYDRLVEIEAGEI